jgi:hypothetical protein
MGVSVSAAGAGLDLKAEQIRQTRVSTVVTPCATCWRSLGQIVEHHNVPAKTEMLMLLVYRAMMAALSRKAVQEADLVLMMVEAAGPHPEDEAIFSLLQTLRIPRFLLINKIDRGPKELLLPIMAEYGEPRFFRSIIPISALTGDGVESLVQNLKSMLKEGPAFFS